ncbi:MAG: phosphonate ABC transporter, permease protein PhnE, partial [Clostridia bacterium]|nr:phosphonate ABC transporter, permease protein PhnE [Clostridia bacterium]
MKKKTAEAAYKTPLLDRIIKPRTITLPNGHTVQKPVSRTPFIAVIVLAVIIISAKVTGFDFAIIINRGYQLGYILGRIFHPNWSYFGGDPANTTKLFNALFDTIKMSIMGSVIGATLALPIAVLSSTNINKNGVVVWGLRILLMIIRTLPTLIIAKFAALIFGLGTFAGTMAIIVFTFGVVAKMMYESIETIDMG